MSRLSFYQTAKNVVSRFLALFILCGAFLVSVARAQNPAEKNKLPISQTFADYFAEQAAQNHIVIAAENIPLYLTISAEEKQSLTASGRGLPVEKNIARQAAFFDYETQALKPNLFVLRKKYTNPSDLPYVSLDEAARFLDMTHRFIARYKSPFKNGSFQADPTFMKTAGSFTPEQLALMKDSKLPVSALSPEQRQQLWNVMVCFYIDNGALGSSSFWYSKLRLDTVRTEAEGRFQHFDQPKNPTPYFIYSAFGFIFPTPKQYKNSK